VRTGIKELERKWASRSIFRQCAPLLHQKSAISLMGTVVAPVRGLVLECEHPSSTSYKAPRMTASWLKFAPWLMLIASNVFMTFAWYGHLKNKSLTFPLAILSSWLIALPEYMLAVPANRLGHQVYSTAQLKTGQEAITLIVFTLFSYFYLGEALKWTTFLGFALIVAGAALVFFFK
jgi:uncharacterized protein (DUF486 family)